MACSISDASPPAWTSASTHSGKGASSTALHGRQQLRSRVPARQAVAAQIGQLTLSAKVARTKHAFAPHTGLQALYAFVLASVHFKRRVPASASTYALQRLANSLTRRGGGKRRYDIKLSRMTAAEAEQQLLLPWDAVPFEVSIFEAIIASSSSSSSSSSAADGGSTAGSEGSYTVLLRHRNTLRFE
eukprot:3109414-Pleurochrysis_carterae.AAC.5